MWKAISEFYLNIHASGLSHEAVIEIMVGLLGVMMAAMSIIAVLASLVFAGLGFFGFQAIQEEAKKTARETATAIANEISTLTLSHERDREQATDLSTFLTPSKRIKKSQSLSGDVKTRVRRTTDSGLQKD